MDGKRTNQRSQTEDQQYIDMTAIAIGTSLPELATAIAGVRKGENDIAVGNIIGANIFNIVIVLGLPALITPGEIDPLAYSRDYSAGGAPRSRAVV